MVKKFKTYAQQDFYSKIGAKLKALRIENGYSTKYIADCLQVSHQQVQKYENGENTTSVRTLFVLAKLYGVDLNYFVDDEIVADQEALCKNRRFLEMMKSFYKIKSQKTKQAISSLVRSIEEQGE